jgi:hypothetical protein
MDDVALKLAFDDRYTFACYSCVDQYHGTGINNITKDGSVTALDDALNGDFTRYFEMWQRLEEIENIDDSFAEVRDQLRNNTRPSCLSSLSVSESLKYTAEDGDVHALPIARKTFSDEVIRAQGAQEVTATNTSRNAALVGKHEFISNISAPLACCLGANYDITMEDFIDTTFVDLTEMELSLTSRRLQGAGEIAGVGSRYTGQCFEVNSSVCFSMYGVISDGYAKCYDDSLGKDEFQFPCKAPTPLDECDTECFKYGYEYASFKGFVFDFDSANLTPVSIGSVILLLLYILFSIRTFNS